MVMGWIRATNNAHGLMTYRPCLQPRHDLVNRGQFVRAAHLSLAKVLLVTQVVSRLMRSDAGSGSPVAVT